MKFAGGWTVSLVNQEVRADYDKNLRLPDKTTRHSLRTTVEAVVEVWASGPDFPEDRFPLTVQILESAIDGARTQYRAVLKSDLPAPFPKQHLKAGDVITFHEDHIRSVLSPYPSFLDPEFDRADDSTPLRNNKLVPGSYFLEKVTDDITLEAYQKTWYALRDKDGGLVAYLPDDGRMDPHDILQLFQTLDRFRPGE